MHKPRILIVEDEVVAVRDLREQLILLGYEPVANAAQGEEAIALAGELRPDLVLTEIDLPGNMDGIAAARAIRERFALPVVFLTAFTSDEVLNRAKLAEPYGYIIKPFKERELRTVIEVALYKHGVETQLRQSHEVQAAILRTALDGFWLIDMQGRVLEVNDACCQMHGYSREEMLGKTISDFEMVDTPEHIAASMAHIRQTGSARFEGRHRCKIGPPIDLEINVNYLPHSGGRFFAFMRDIAARKHLQEERDVTVRLFEVVNGKNNLHDLMQAATLLLRDWSGCSSVGIRLKMGAEFPYFEVRGFPGKFVQAASRLCQHDAAGQVVSDSAGHPVLQCLCGNVIAGRFDPTEPFFTVRGSFWTNSTTDLLANTTEAERQARTRNCCRGENYESMALVPLRVGETTLGLLQLNDRRRGRFTPERIKFFERLADSLAIAIADRTANEATLRSVQEFSD